MVPNATPDAYGQPSPRYGRIAPGTTVETFRYQRDVAHLRSLGIRLSTNNKRSNVVVAVVRAQTDQFSETFPEWVVTTVHSDRSLNFRVRPYDIEGKRMEGHWSTNVNQVSIDIETITATGYLFPPFNRLLKADIGRYVRYLQDYDRPPPASKMPRYAR